MDDDPFKIQESQTSKLRVSRDRHQWVEGNFVAPDITDEHAVLYSQTDGYMGTVLTRRNVLQLAVVFVLACFVIILRAGHLQVVHGADYSSLSDQNRLRFENVFSDRGLIYDRYQNALVHNVPNYTVSINPKLLPGDDQERDRLLTSLYTHYFSAVTKQSVDAFISTFEQARKNRSLFDKDLRVADALPQDQAILLQIATKDIPAITVQKNSRRDYLNEGPTGGESDDTIVYPPVKSLSPILGYMTHLQEGEYDQLKGQGYLYNDSIGRTGLEAEYETALRGTYGKREIEVDAQGRFKQMLNQQSPDDGQSLLTSIDLELQRNAEAILRHWLEKSKKQAGTIVVLNPNNGDVLALVNVPTYDDNLFSKGLTQEDSQSLFQDPNRPLFNRAISGEYPSGSIFKPIVAAAALDEGVITDRTTFLSTGGIQINNFFFPDWKAGGHGQTNVYKALAESVNTYFYIVGGGYQSFEGLGVQRITDAAEHFGLSQPLGIDLPGEASGFLPSKEWKESVKKERWYVGDTYHLAIGQGDLLVTPLQMASVIATFANGGTLYRPRIVTATLDKNLQVIEQKPVTVLDQQAASPASIAVVRTGLRQVVTTGSGRRLGDLSIDVAGKTGTAQWNTQKPPHAWFVGYAPSKHPAIAFSIFVEEGEEGSAITVSIAHDLLTWWQENRT